MGMGVSLTSLSLFSHLASQRSQRSMRSKVSCWAFSIHHCCSLDQCAALQASKRQASTVVQDGLLAAACALLYVAFWSLHFIALGVNGGLSGMAWAALVGFAALVAVCRHNIRSVYGIEGSGPEDFFVALFMWPQVLAQMARQVTEEVKPKKVIEEVKPDKMAVEAGLTQAEVEL